MIKAIDIAPFVIKHCHTRNYAITPLKLQKLIYYLKVWSIVDDKPLIQDDFCRWKLGPVSEVLYEAYKDYGRKTIDLQKLPNHVNLDDYQASFLHFIVDVYGVFDAVSLSMMTHNEDPWIATPADQVIQEDQIKKYYSQRRFALNLPFDRDHRYHPLRSNMTYSYTLDMADNDSERSRIYSTYEDYRAGIDRASQELREAFGPF